MSDSIKIGQIYGIPIELHWTLVLLIFFTFLSAMLQFEYFGLLFTILLLLFVCILLHELAHSITSIRNKVEVQKIVLTPLGGASIIDDTRIDPHTDFRIVLAGPLMSLFLASLFGLLGIYTPTGFFSSLFQELFILNLFMAVFNILPIFPMDGGRIFRSYMQNRMDFFDATMLTVRLSSYLLGIIVIVTVLFSFFATGYSPTLREYVAFGNLIIVALFYGGAQSEKKAAIIRRNTEGITVNSALSKNYTMVNPKLKLSQLYARVKSRKGHVIVTKVNGRYALVDLFKNDEDPNLRVVDISVPIPELPPDTSIADAFIKMQLADFGLIAVVKRKRLLGVTTASMLQTIITLYLLNRKNPRKRKSNKL